MDLAPVKCIISGGAQGLGRHFALRLCQAGAQVAIGDVNAGPGGHAGAGARGAARSTRGASTCRTSPTSAPSSSGRTRDGRAQRGSMNNAGILRDGLLVKKDRRDRRR